MLELGMDGKITEMHLVVMSVILLIRLTLKMVNIATKLRCRAQNTQPTNQPTSQLSNPPTPDPPERRTFRKLTVAH